VHEHGAINYFDAAWQARDVLATATGYPVPRSAIGMAVNHVHARSQDQLHIHLSCLDRFIYDVLQADAERFGHAWTPLVIGDRQYEAMRIMGQQLGTSNPFELLADYLTGAKDTMGEYTLLVAGMEFKDGAGFVLLAGNAVPGAERLLDSSCTVVR
jgi:CDP-diacylglycerol pyrophosphatase